MENQSNDLDVFDFTEADHIPNDEPWRRKLRKPSSDYPLLNNPFIEKASSRSAIETKQALTVELAEDDVVDNSADHQDSPHKDGLNGSEGFNATPDKNFEQHCSFSEGSVRPEIPSSCTPVGLTVGDGDVTPMIQESRVFVADSIVEMVPPVAGETSSQSTANKDGDVEITCFSDVLDGATVYFQILRLSKQIYVWIGCNSAKLGCLYAAAPTRPTHAASVTSLLGGTSDNTGAGIARRLVIRTGLNIILACNLPKNNPMLEISAEKKLAEKLISLGYSKPKSERQSVS